MGCHLQVSAKQGKIDMRYLIRAEIHAVPKYGRMMLSASSAHQKLAARYKTGYLLRIKLYLAACGCHQG